ISLLHSLLQLGILFPASLSSSMTAGGIPSSQSGKLSRLAQLFESLRTALVAGTPASKRLAASLKLGNLLHGFVKDYSEHARACKPILIAVCESSTSFAAKSAKAAISQL